MKKVKRNFRKFFTLLSLFTFLFYSFSFLLAKPVYAADDLKVEENSSDFNKVEAKEEEKDNFKNPDFSGQDLSLETKTEPLDGEASLNPENLNSNSVSSLADELNSGNSGQSENTLSQNKLSLTENNLPQARISEIEGLQGSLNLVWWSPVKIKVVAEDQENNLSKVELYYRLKGTQDFQKYDTWFWSSGEQAGNPATEIFFEFDFKEVGGMGSYEFYALAYDRDGGKEALPSQPEIEIAYYYPLINEVYFDNTDGLSQYIEIYNPSTFTFNLSNWIITDNNGSGSGEAVYAFPQNTFLGAYQYIVIARNATEFKNNLLFWPDFEIDESKAEVPNLEKIGGSLDLYLDKAGDEVYLKDNNDFLVDMVCWGDTNEEHPFRGDIDYGYSLERKGFQDTDRCDEDFQLSQPTPQSFPYLLDFTITPPSPTNKNQPVVEAWPVDFNLNNEKVWVYFEDREGNLFRAQLNVSHLPYFQNDGLSFERKVDGIWVKEDYLPDGVYRIYLSLEDTLGNYIENELEGTYIIDTLAPVPPVPFLVKRTSNSITLSWSASTDENSGIAGYIVFWGKKAGVFENSMDVGNTLSATIASLLPDTTYYFAVQSYDMAGNKSELSQAVKATTLKEISSTEKWNVKGGKAVSFSAPSSETQKEIKGEEGTNKETSPQNKNIDWVALAIALVILGGVKGAPYFYEILKRKFLKPRLPL